MHLPEKFQKEMEILLGDEYQAFKESYDRQPENGLRLNRRKVTGEEFLTRTPFLLKKIPWIDNGYTYGTGTPAKDPYYYAGLYYLQEPSAMTPANRLSPEPGDYVLDLCAAPGGKATELGAKLNGEGLLLANDISNSRAKALLKNLELMGIPNIYVTSETSEKLAKILPEFFDKILVDAPCSGEGMFRKEPRMMADWEQQGPEYYSKLQREIILDAADMLRPGGKLLYSTCTFSELENEGTIQYLLEQRPDMKLIPCAPYEGFAKGRRGLEACVRIFPHRMIGEGHFLARERKKSEVSKKIPTPVGHPAKPGERHPNRAESRKIQGKKSSASEDTGLRELEAFLRSCRISWEKERMFIHQEHVYYLPCGLETGLPLRFLRTGLLIGELKKGRFEPSQALAMALRIEEYPVVLNHSEEDERVARYLKGETISLLPEEGPIKGWCLVAYRGFPLGWAKGNNMTLKNKYYPGWLLQ